MPDEAADLKQQLEALLASHPDRGTLLRELSGMAALAPFADLAPLWAPAIYGRDAGFFDSFLERHLNAHKHRAVIAELLTRAEADGRDDLFKRLYAKTIREGSWNEEILALAGSARASEEVLRAVQRRDMRRQWFTLAEPAALALYRRDPDLFSDFIQAHVHVWWGSRDRYKTLRKEAQERSDDLHWALFRELADGGEWAREVRQLIAANTPADRIDAELKRRHPQRMPHTGSQVAGELLTRYGAAVLPYIETHRLWYGSGGGGRRVLEAVRKLNDEPLYWRLFFRVGDRKLWNEELRSLVARVSDDAVLLLELEIRSPRADARMWPLDADIALALYRRNHGLFGPFVQRHLREADTVLFREALRASDQEFLNFVTFRLLDRLRLLAYRANLSKSQLAWGVKPDPKARAELDQISRLVLDHYEALHQRSPAEYVRHVANVLGRYGAFEIWSFRREMEENPVFAHFAGQHHDEWLRSPEAIRDLLESTNIYVQIIALEMLKQGGPDAAERVLENAPKLRALLLGQARRNTKRLVLHCLLQAAREGPTAPPSILPLLAEAMDFRGEVAIDEEILAGYVRVRRELITAGRWV